MNSITSDILKLTDTQPKHNFRNCLPTDQIQEMKFEEDNYEDDFEDDNPPNNNY